MRKLRRRGKITIWFSDTLGPLVSMGMSKDEPRYREMKRRMRIQSRDIAAVIIVLILIVVGGLIWALLAAP